MNATANLKTTRQYAIVTNYAATITSLSKKLTKAGVKWSATPNKRGLLIDAPDCGTLQAMIEDMYPSRTKTNVRSCVIDTRKRLAGPKWPGMGTSQAAMYFYAPGKDRDYDYVGIFAVDAVNGPGQFDIGDITAPEHRAAV